MEMSENQKTLAIVSECVVRHQQEGHSLEEVLRHAIREAKAAHSAEPTSSKIEEAIDFAGGIRQNAYKRMMDTGEEYWKGELVAADAMISKLIDLRV